MKLVSNLKQMMIPAGRQPRKVLAGPFRDITMDLSLHSQSQIYLGLFERETYGWLEDLASGIQTAVDIGAAYGEYSLYFLLKTKAKVYAFEPEADSIASIEKNLRLNGLGMTDRLLVSSAFVGSVAGDHTVRLDSLASSIKGPCMIKMDVDGAEQDILNGATELNKLPGVRWLIETHSKQLERDCAETLQSQGFRTAIIENAWWRIFVPETRHVEQNRWLAAWKPADLPNLTSQ